MTLFDVAILTLIGIFVFVFLYPTVRKHESKDGRP